MVSVGFPRELEVFAVPSAHERSRWIGAARGHLIYVLNTTCMCSPWAGWVL